MKYLRFTGFVLTLLWMGCIHHKENTTHKSLCEEYDWSAVEDLVVPYLNDFEMTSLVMQGQSSEYKVSAAADHALAFRDSYPDSLNNLLEEISKKDC
jgi:hypothetical protein